MKRRPTEITELKSERETDDRSCFCLLSLIMYTPAMSINGIGASLYVSNSLSSSCPSIDQKNKLVRFDNVTHSDRDSFGSTVFGIVSLTVPGVINVFICLCALLLAILLFLSALCSVSLFSVLHNFACNLCAFAVWRHVLLTLNECLGPELVYLTRQYIFTDVLTMYVGC